MQSDSKPILTVFLLKRSFFGKNHYFVYKGHINLYGNRSVLTQIIKLTTAISYFVQRSTTNHLIFLFIYLKLMSYSAVSISISRGNRYLLTLLVFATIVFSEFIFRSQTTVDFMDHPKKLSNLDD